ncbi:MAG: hypothetical protein K0U47_12665, partial [Epsilonproteobacteria bacterium]|nr:hypothetical protein [Campylobacterota bacterium]
ECIKQRVKKSNGMMRTDIYLLDLLKLNQERVITRLDKIENSKLLVSIGKNSRKNLTLVITQYSTINTYINYVISQHELTPNNIQELDQTIVPVYKNIIFLIESIRKNINGEHYQLKIYNQDAFSHIYSTNKQRFCI